ncbi:hypothetical protein A9404_12070 [Halothiobacillus diazotrophicus]|uniref:DUF4396 domain-containing protein n=1 Tax=Halothiobacillus diazotrophicus TaxID=1860122 RepID=A0A191ZKT6_9GAMM|nr:DUF4396 domain-containing protein [Halothiobacillus diazotrophicus]ANJ68475.1 hypothetical protein A9404_12070 [Halothiobacillus diazotrophicus]
MADWLTLLAFISLILAILSALIIVIDIFSGYRQHMWIMNVVWPVTALYAGPLALWAYFSVGRLSSHRVMQTDKANGNQPRARHKPYWQSIGLAATHCGSGCTLGDLLAEGIVMSWVPFTLFGHQIFATWVVDFILAFLIGIAFQYFTIVPMKHLTPMQGLIAAVKADTLSLTAWQVGMYGWMAVATFLIFGQALRADSPIFWFMMQIAMLFGFATSYPVNWWLVRAGIKETM